MVVGWGGAVVASSTSAMIVGWGGAVVRVIAATGVPLIPTHGVAGVGGAGRQKLIKGDHTLVAVEDGAVATQGRRVVVVVVFVGTIVLRAAVRKVFVDVGFGKLGVVFCAFGSVAIVGAIAIDEIALRDAIGKVVHMAFQDIVAQWIRTASFKQSLVHRRTIRSRDIENQLGAFRVFRAFVLFVAALVVIVVIVVVIVVVVVAGGGAF